MKISLQFFQGEMGYILKNLAIFSLIFMLLVLPGCTPSKDGGQEETGSKAPTEETTKAPEPAQKPEKDEHKAQLIEYAEKNLRQLQFVYAASGVDVTFDDFYSLKDLKKLS